MRASSPLLCDSTQRLAQVFLREPLSFFPALAFCFRSQVDAARRSVKIQAEFKRVMENTSLEEQGKVWTVTLRKYLAAFTDEVL